MPGGSIFYQIMAWLLLPSNYRLCQVLRPYHALLLLGNENEFLEGLSTDASPALRRLVRQATPLKSFKTLAIDTDLSLMQV